MKREANPGRVAGFLYLLLGFSVLRIKYIPGALFVYNDPAATAHNIDTHELLFRFGMVSDIMAGVSCVIVAMALYRLLSGVSQGLAVFMVILGGLLPAVLDCFNVVNDVAALFAVNGEFMSPFDSSQRNALAMLFLRVHDYGFLTNEIFAGLWLLPFGVLVFRSGFIPRILGVYLVINGLAYVTISITGFLWPQYVDRVSSKCWPALFGEGAIVLWLMIKGARPPREVVQ
ncbi:MAG: DUF4386 domain-containing protein [Verrucomicrobiota bacterium]|jgi:hypothetical protein